MSIDQFVFSDSEKSSEVPFIFESKKYQVINDSNNSSYQSSCVKIETVGLSLCDTYLHYADAYLNIPIVIACYAAGVDFSTTYTDFMLGLKNSHLVFVDKIVINSDGICLVQQCSDVNQVLIFNEHCNKNSNYEDNLKHMTGYCADNGMSWGYSANANTCGHGIYNNAGSPVQLPSGGRSANTEVFNDGFYKRMLRFQSNSATNKRRAFTDKTENDCGDVDYIDNSQTGFKVYYCNVRIALKDLPFFKNFPLSKSTLLSMDIYVNTGTFSINKAATTGVLTQLNTNLNGSCNPLLFSAGWCPVQAQLFNSGTDANTSAQDITNPTYNAGGASSLFSACGSSNLPLNTTVNIAIGITKVTLAGTVFSHKNTVCNLTVPAYKMTPQIEKSYISVLKKKHVWEDYSSFILNVQANSSVSSYIGSRNRLQRVVIIPMLQADGNSTTNLIPKNSAFATEPSTTSPVGSLLRSLNIEIGGQLVFRSDVQYDPILFLNLLESTQNGSMSQSLCGGRFNLENWINLYGYICVNVRKSVVDAQNDLRVKLSCSSICSKNISLYIFLCYEKSCDVNLITGQLENIVV